MDTLNWFRVYHDIIDDPKILALPRVARWHVVELYAVASKQPERGQLPCMKDIAIHLRMSTKKASAVIDMMISHGFVDSNTDRTRLSIHGWEKRQFKSDDINSRSRAAMQRSRERSPNDSVNVHLAGACSETDTETETEQRGNPPSPPPSIKPLGPEYEALGRWAQEFMGDVSWGQWVMAQGHIGHSVEWIRAAIEISVGSGKRAPGWIAAKLRGWQNEGGPPREVIAAIAIAKPEESMSPELKKHLADWEAKRASAG